VRLSLSVPLVKGDRVGTMLVGVQSVRHVVQVCLEGCYVCENVAEGTGWRGVIGCLIFIGHFPQRALRLVALLQKITCNIRHPMSLRHPVTQSHVWWNFLGSVVGGSASMFDV